MAAHWRRACSAAWTALALLFSQPALPQLTTGAGQLQGKVGNDRASVIAQIAPNLKAGLTAQEAAAILGTPAELNEVYRANGIQFIARAKKLGPQGADAALILKGTTGNNRTVGIAEIAPYLKTELTAQEAADILGTPAELSEVYRATAIQFIARAKKLGALGAEAALMLKGTTGNNRALGIAEIAPYLKTGLTAQEVADILGTPTELNEVYRATAIQFIARAKKLGALGAEAALMLEGTTGNNRAVGIAEIAPYLKTGLTAQEVADILGTPTELSEVYRASAIQFIARARKVTPGLTEAELAPVLNGTSGSNRALALAELKAAGAISATAGQGAVSAQKPASTTGSTTGVFDGSFYNHQFRFGFRVTGNQGIATISNSPNYKPGDVMLRFTPRGPRSFVGEQLCTDGIFHPVTGTLAQDGSLDMTIQGCFPSRYKMVRQITDQDLATEASRTCGRSPTEISGRWDVRREGMVFSSPIPSAQTSFSYEDSRLVASGQSWRGEGIFDGCRGYYDWQFQDGKRGRTEIVLDSSGVLHGKVRGSGIDWDYMGTRMSSALEAPSSASTAGKDWIDVAAQVALEITEQFIREGLTQVTANLVSDAIVALGSRIPTQVANQLLLSPRKLVGWAARITSQEGTKDFFRADPVGLAAGVVVEMLVRAIRDTCPCPGTPLGNAYSIEMFVWSLRQAGVGYAFARAGLHGAIAAEAIVTVVTMHEALIEANQLLQEKNNARESEVLGEILQRVRNFASEIRTETDPQRKAAKLQTLNEYLRNEQMRIPERASELDAWRQKLVASLEQINNLREVH